MSKPPLEQQIGTAERNTQPAHREPFHAVGNTFTREHLTPFEIHIALIIACSYAN